jgi:hypothetical protein
VHETGSAGGQHAQRPVRWAEPTDATRSRRRRGCRACRKGAGSIPVTPELGCGNLSPCAQNFSASLAGPVAVLLHADDISTRARLGTRLIDRDLDAATAASAGTAARLEADAPEEVHRVNTIGRLPADVASKLKRLTGWAPRKTAAAQP